MPRSSHRMPAGSVRRVLEKAISKSPDLHMYRHTEDLLQARGGQDNMSSLQWNNCEPRSLGRTYQRCKFTKGLH